MSETATLSPNSVEVKPKAPETKSAKSDISILRMATVMERKNSGAPKEEQNQEIKDDKQTDGEAKPKEAETTSSVKPKEEPKSETTPKKEVKENKSPEPKPTQHKADTKEWWQDESKKHQSRADIAESELTKLKSEQLEPVIAERDRYKALVERFEKAPLDVIQDYLPQIQEQLALNSGDNLTFVEQNVAKAKKHIDSEFAKSYGEDWRYNEFESMTPGTPSFKYKEAMETARMSARGAFSDYVQKQRQAVDAQREQVVKDKVRLKEEFGLSDDDFKTIEDFASKNSWSYYLTAKVALFDKLMNQAIEKARALSPQRPPATISRTSETTHTHTAQPDITPQGKLMASRLGAKNFYHRS